MDEELAKLVKVVTPEDGDEWEERRSRWNLFSETEATVRLVAVPKDTDDVVKIVNWAREHKQTNVGVRSGGHGFFSSAEVVVDMREGFNYTTVDEATGICTIGMGQTLGQVDERTQPWHVPVGVVSHTGCGLLVTGGVGYLCKAHGASADNIIECTIVTSDGTVHTCSKDHEPDLFFAVRGAAPNLGVITQVKAQGYKHPDALCTLRAWPATSDNLKRLIAWADQDAVLNDTNMTVYIALIPSPDLKARLCAIHVVCVGPEEEDDKYRELIGQLEGTDGDTPLLPTSRVPFSTPQTIFDATFPKQFWYVSQTYFPGDVTIADAAVDDTLNEWSKIPLGPTVPLVIFEQRGNQTSAYHKFASDSCAQPRFGQRWEAYVFFGTQDKENAEAMRSQGRAVKDTILKHAHPGGRCHFTKDEPARVDFYYGPNTDKVRQVVAKYDPNRLFASCNGMEF
mmetsp:Transcript_25573/g.55918  ORF Transcript_25573/g.55918 Transcript_25573/m.55918 type:complete len:453 (-) Transcript_25573:219-1577(-)